MAMNDLLKQRILRALETLDDDKGYQVLDFVEFLESRYAARQRPTGILAKITETVEDTMRAGKLPIQAISGTMGLMDMPEIGPLFAALSGMLAPEKKEAVREKWQQYQELPPEKREALAAKPAPTRGGARTPAPAPSRPAAARRLPSQGDHPAAFFSRH